MSDDARWLETMPEVYDRCLGPALFAPFAKYLAERVAARDPADVLELAAGSGVLTAELIRALPSARITATDLNEAMVSWGAQHVPGPHWTSADAQSLDFPDESFDVIVCQFGAMFFPDKVASFREAARVLRADGAYLFVVWDTVESSAFPAALTAALHDVFPDDPPDFVTRIPHGYHDIDRIEHDVLAGGLQVDGIDRLTLHGVAPSTRALAQGYCLGTPLRFELQERGDPERIADAVADRMTSLLGAGAVEGDLTALSVSARVTSDGTGNS